MRLRFLLFDKTLKNEEASRERLVMKTKDTQRGSCIEHSEMPFERPGNDDDKDGAF